MKMKKISFKILKFRIRLLQKILAIIGITAVISSCGGNSEEAVEIENDTIVTDVLEVDSVVIKDSIPASVQPTKPVFPPKKDTPVVVPVEIIPDLPVTMYGVPVYDQIETKYGIPLPLEIDEI